MSKYYKSANTDRPAHDLSLMLRIHFLQLWHNLSDPATEEAIYDWLSFQHFLGFDCFGGIVPDESSICRFRHFLEEKNLTKKILKIVNQHLEHQGLILKEGTIVDATLFQAPVSKKNKKKERDPEMSSTRKNNKWYFGAKGHIVVQANGKPLIHSVDFITAKNHDITVLENLFHGEEQAIFGDSAYSRRADKKAARASGMYYGISDRGVRKHPLSSHQEKRNRRHSSVRNKVEPPFRVIKTLWGHGKLRYKGLEKNAHQFTTLCALTNIYMCRKMLIPPDFCE
ncbi:MAG: IS5 family transposase [Alphaproteobacteria bacterium]